MSKTYGAIAYDAESGRWIVSDLQPHVAIRLKHVFPRVDKASSDIFKFPCDDLHAEDLGWFMSRYPLDISRSDAIRMNKGRRRFADGRAAVESILTPEWKPTASIAFKDGKSLRPYQDQAAAMFRITRELLLLDDLGLGKTVSALGAILDEAYLPAAIVVEPHLTEQWRLAIEEFTHLRVHVIAGRTPYDLPEADIYLYRYSNVLGWIDMFKQLKFPTVVYDEIQNLRTGDKSEKGRACAALSRHAQARMGLSATPIFNYGNEMRAVVEFVSAGALGTEEEFNREWCSGDGKKVRNPDALGAYLRERQILLRRSKKDVNDQTPPVNPILYEIPYDLEAERQVEDLARTLAVQVLSSGSFVERGNAARELNSLMRHATGVAKARHVANYVRILLENKVPTLLVGWHREVYDIWLKELREFEPAMYTGSESVARKVRTAEEFKAGRTDLMIMSLRSGAGLDGLQERCSDVVFGELDWSPQVHAQVIGRLHRDGQRNSVNAIFLHADGGSDPAIIETLGIKTDQSRGILDPFAAVVETPEIDDGRIRLLAESFLRRRGILVPQSSMAA